MESEQKSTKQRCWLHQVNGDHPIWRCRLFQIKSPEEKVDLTKKHNACFACLEVGHTANNCKRGFKCRQDGCNLPHHDLLHEAHAAGVVFHNIAAQNNSKTILQVQNIRCYSQNSGHQTVNVLWDGASTISLITFEAAKRLNLRGKKVRLEIEGVGGRTSVTDSFKYEVTLIDAQNKSVPIEVLGIHSISKDIVEASSLDVSKTFGNDSSEFERPKAGSKIDCLIGFDYASFHPTRLKSAGHLLMLENRFGLVFGGSNRSLDEATNRTIESAHIFKVQGDFRDFTSIESLGVQCSPRCGSCKCGNCHPGGKDMSLKEEREYRMIDENLIYLQDEKRWKATYPWVRDPKELPNNRQVVHAKLQSTERRLLKNKEYANQYNKQIHDMVARGASRKVSDNELDAYDGPIHYISHHAVLKPESKSTPCRIVFNSSVNFQGHVLYEYYAKGPDMLNNLLGVLL